MSEWREVAVEDLAAESKSALATGPFGSAVSKKHFVDEGVPMIRGSNLSTDVGTRLTDDEIVFLAPDVASKFQRSTVRNGDLVFTCWGTIGQIGLIDDSCRFDHYIVSNKQMKLTPNSKLADSQFLYYSLSSAQNLDQVQRQAIGSAVPGFNLGQLRQIRISLPDLDTQRSVTSVLRSVDDLIENNRRRIEVLEEMAQAIYREWFVRFRYPGHEDAIFVDSPLGPIPEGWEVNNLAHVASLDKGLSYKGVFLTEDGVPMANLKCIRADGGFRRDGTKPYSGPSKQKHEIVGGDIVMANTDLTQAGGVIGAAALVPDSGFAGGGIISHHLFAVRPHDRRHRHWLVASFNDSAFREFARGVASGTTVLGLRVRDVEQREVVVPAAEVAHEFEQANTERTELVDTLHDASDRLASIRDLLLPKLVTGEIDVSELDLDAVVEAASS